MEVAQDRIQLGAVVLMVLNLWVLLPDFSC